MDPNILVQKVYNFKIVQRRAYLEKLLANLFHVGRNDDEKTLTESNENVAVSEPVVSNYTSVPNNNNNWMTVNC